MTTNRQLSIRIDADRHRAFRLACVKRDLSMTEILERMVKIWVEMGESGEPRVVSKGLEDMASRE